LIDLSSPEQYAEAAKRAFHGQKFAEAEICAQHALSDDARQPLASEIMGLIRLNEGRFDEAIGYFKGGLEADPTRAELPNLIGVAYAQKKGHLATAMEYFQLATQAAPSDPSPWENLGKAAYELRDWDAARDAFTRCHELDGKNLEARLGFARLALRDGEFARAYGFASQIAAEVPHHLVALQLTAEAALKLGSYKEALAAAVKAAEHPRAWPRLRDLSYGIAAEAAEALGRYDEAFSYYTEMNNAVAEIHWKGLKEVQEIASFEKLAELAQITPQVAEKAATWPNEFDTPAPVFCVGFARSGISLLEQALDLHPKIVNGAARVDSDMWKDILWDQDAPARVASLTYEDIQELRREYWRMVEQGGIEIPEGSMLMEFRPFFSQHLALFAMVFPDSKYIVTHRDPRDVVLSCFKKRSPVNRSMYEFLGLRSTARFYDLAMGAARAARESFGLDQTLVGYDTFVADMENETRRMIEFVGLEWDPSLIPAREAKIDPASIEPEKRAVSKAQQKWRNYETHLEPVNDLLSPWISYWGYSD